MTGEKKHKLKTPQLALPISLSDKACFENYWVGDNGELVSALKQTVQIGELKPIYYYGPNGAGKSHLLYALMRLAKQNSIQTSYLGLKDLSPSLGHQIVDMVNPKQIVCVDDIDVWLGEVRSEEGLFTLFEQVKHAGGQLVVTASKPPADVSVSLTDLRSRLASGLVYPLYKLNEEQCFDAIKMRAGYRGMSISEEAVKYLLARLPRDITQLFAVLDKIDQASLVEKRKITIPFLHSLKL